MPFFRSFVVALALAAAASTAAAQDTSPQEKPPANPPAGTGRTPPAEGSGPRIKMGGGEAGQGKEEPAAPKPEAKSEPEQWIEQLATWPSGAAKQASIRLATIPSVAWPLIEHRMLEPNQDWRMIAGCASTLGKLRDLRGIDLLRAKLEDRGMYQHATEVIDAIVRIDPVGAKPRLVALLLHPASAVVADAEKLLTDRVAPTDVDTLRDVYDAGGASARASALRLIAKADPVAARSHFVRALGDAEPDVAFAAANGLAHDPAPEALDLTLKAFASPVDRIFAYSAVSLALRTERAGPRVVDDGLTRTLLSGRGLKSLDPLCRAAATTLIADLGYYHDVPMLDEVLDRMVVPLLIDTWVSREFWPDMKVLQPLAMKRLRRLTGLKDLDTPQQWTAWWEREAAGFVSRRVLSVIPDDALGTLLVALEGQGAPGGETTIVTSAAEMVGPQVAGELTLLVTAEDACALANTVNDSGVLSAYGAMDAVREIPRAVGVWIRAGRRERRATLRPGDDDKICAPLVAAFNELRSRYAWQRYRTATNSLDAQAFVLAMSKAFAPERTREERDASLAALIVESIDDRRGEAWNLRALADLESMEKLPLALGPKETDGLLAILGRRESLDPTAAAIVRVLAKARKPEATPLLLDFLATRGSVSARPLYVVVLGNATREQFREALSDARPEVRLAAFEAARPETVDDDAITRILKSVDDKDRIIAADAVRALGRLRLEQARPLLDRLAQVSSDLRPAAVEALGMLGGRESLPTIMTAYASDDVGLRVAAIQALGAAREPEGISAIVFAISGDPSSLVREVAGRVVVDMGSDRAAAELRKLVIDPAQPAGPRARALAGYAQLRGKGSLGDLAKLVEDPSEEVSDAAAMELARWRDPAGVVHLIAMLENDRSVQRARYALESVSLESFAQKDPKMLADLYGGWWELSKSRGPRLWLLDALSAEGEEDAGLRAWAESGASRQAVPALLKAVRHEKWYIRRAADLALRELLGRNVGDQDPWTTAGDVKRLADLWEGIWGEALGK
jgi:HEAT repeat protein